MTTKNDPMDMARHLMERQKRRANAAVIVVNYNDPAIREWSARAALKEVEYDRMVEAHLSEFCSRSGATYGMGESKRSNYDAYVTIHPPEMAGAYLTEATPQFPEFTFVRTIDPNERPAQYVLIDVISEGDN